MPLNPRRTYGKMTLPPSSASASASASASTIVVPEWQTTPSGCDFVAYYHSLRSALEHSVGLFDKSEEQQSSGSITIDKTMKDSKIDKLAEVDKPSECYSLKFGKWKHSSERSRSMTADGIIKNSRIYNPAEVYPSYRPLLPLFIPMHDPFEKDAEQKVISCFSPFKEEYYPLSIPGLPVTLAFCCGGPMGGPMGTSHGWLVILYENDKVILLNPISSEVLTIPAMPPSLITGYDHFAVLTPPPNYTVYFICENRHIIFFCFCCTKTFWRKLPFCQELNSEVTAAVTPNGNLYLLSHYWDLYCVYPHSATIKHIKMNDAYLPLSARTSMMATLMEAEGLVLLILKTDGEFQGPPRCLVFKADIDNRIWIRLDDFGDRVIFKHALTCASFSIADMGCRWKGNRIFYTSNFVGPCEVFDLVTGELVEETVADDVFSKPWDYPCSMIMPC